MPLPLELPAPLGLDGEVLSPFEESDPRFVDHVKVALQLLAEQYKEE